MPPKLHSPTLFARLVIFPPIVYVLVPKDFSNFSVAQRCLPLALGEGKLSIEQSLHG